MPPNPKQKTIFNSFRQWSKDNNTTFIIKNEQNLIADFDASLVKAVKSLVDSEDFDHLSSYQKAKNYGYILGFISSNLGLHWHMKYVAPASIHFQQTQSIRAVLDLLKFDKLIQINHEKIFKELIESKVSIVDFKPDNAINLLESLLDDMTTQFVDSIEFEYVSTDILQEYLSYDVLEKLIADFNVGKIES